MAGRRWVPAIAVTTAAALAAAAVWYGPPAVAIPGGIALALLLPGLAATRALFADGESDRPERLALAVALSTAILVLGGLALYASGVRLTRLSWLALTGGTVLVLSVVGYLRRLRRSGAGGDAVENEPAEPAPPALRTTVLRTLCLLLAAGLLAGAGYLAVHSAKRPSGPSFTELSLVPAGPEKPVQRVAVEVASHERELMRYRVVVAGPRGFTATFEPEIWPGSSWARTVAVPTGGKITVELFRPGDTTAYRTVWLSADTVSGCAPPANAPPANAPPGNSG